MCTDIYVLLYIRIFSIISSFPFWRSLSADTGRGETYDGSSAHVRTHTHTHMHIATKIMIKIIITRYYCRAPVTDLRAHTACSRTCVRRLFLSIHLSVSLIMSACTRSRGGNLGILVRLPGIYRCTGVKRERRRTVKIRTELHTAGTCAHALARRAPDRP